jgi:hypothetical protein
MEAHRIMLPGEVITFQIVLPSPKEYGAPSGHSEEEDLTKNFEVSGFLDNLSQAFNAMRQARYSLNCLSSFSFTTWKVSPGKSFFSNVLNSEFRNPHLEGRTFLWMIPQGVLD